MEPTDELVALRRPRDLALEAALSIRAGAAVSRYL